MLRESDWDVEFHVHANAFAYTISSILTQPREHKIDYHIYFASIQLHNVEKNYTTMECEGLVVIFSYKKY